MGLFGTNQAESVKSAQRAAEKASRTDPVRRDAVRKARTEARRNPTRITNPRSNS